MICSSVIFRQLLQSIGQHLQTNVSSDSCNAMIEEFCQCFETILPQMNRTSSIEVRGFIISSRISSMFPTL